MGEAPVLAAARVEMSAEVTVDAAGLGDDLHVLLEKGVAEGAGEEIGGAAAEEVVAVLDAATGEEGVVGGEISALVVLDEKHDIINVIEEFLGDQGGAEALEKVLSEGVGCHRGGGYTDLWSGSGVFHKTAFRRMLLS